MVDKGLFDGFGVESCEVARGRPVEAAVDLGEVAGAAPGRVLPWNMRSNGWASVWRRTSADAAPKYRPSTGSE